MSLRLTRLAPLVLAAGILVAGRPAFAVNKDMIQLQTQIQQLQDTIARLQQSNDERMGVLNNLVQQNVDQTNKIANIVDALQRQLATQQENGGGKIDQLSTQIQSLNDSLDEIKARISQLDKSVQGMRSQQQNLSTPPPATTTPDAAPSAATPPAAADSGALPPSGTTGQPASSGADGFSRDVARSPGRTKPSAATPADSSQAAPAATPDTGAAASAGSTPPADQLYRSALTDYMSAKYAVASSEFSDLIRAYADNPLAGNSWYYQGEIEYRGARFGNAVRNYDHVLDEFPQSSKVPAAHLHKGQALIQLKQNEAASREFHTLISRFPNSPEALQAKTRLNSLGLSTRAR